MTTTQVDYAANLALWLIEKRGTTLATWGTRMTADQQRALFGRVLGKGTIVVDGERNWGFLGRKVPRKAPRRGARSPSIV